MRLPVPSAKPIPTVQPVLASKSEPDHGENNTAPFTLQKLQPIPVHARATNPEEFWRPSLSVDNSVPSQNSKRKLESSAGLGPGPASKHRKNRQLFQYGNYNQYYGYRALSGADSGRNKADAGDIRLLQFPNGFFSGRDILDVGCNIGHVTMTIARDYGAQSVMGIDIDPKLIQIAKSNVKHYQNKSVVDVRKIPFPYNTSFRHENYVLESDEMLDRVKEEYDIVLCLSISKWIHLNYGDAGLKRFFLRAYRHLRPGGKLVLEPQPWSSYKKKKNLTEQIFETYSSIQMMPDQFPDYLLNEVGFVRVDQLTTPEHQSKGFQRPLMVFTKANVYTKVIGITCDETVPVPVLNFSPGPASYNNADTDSQVGGGSNVDANRKNASNSSTEEEARAKAW